MPHLSQEQLTLFAGLVLFLGLISLVALLELVVNKRKAGELGTPHHMATRTTITGCVVPFKGHLRC